MSVANKLRIVCLINNVIYLLSVQQSRFHPLPISKIKQTSGGSDPLC